MTDKKLTAAERAIGLVCNLDEATAYGSTYGLRNLGFVVVSAGKLARLRQANELGTVERNELVAALAALRAEVDERYPDCTQEAPPGFLVVPAEELQLLRAKARLADAYVAWNGFDGGLHIDCEEACEACAREAPIRRELDAAYAALTVEPAVPDVAALRESVPAEELAALRRCVAAARNWHEDDHPARDEYADAFNALAALEAARGK